MILISTILFGVAAVGGIILAFRKERPMPLSIVHGLVAATALVLLIFGVISGGVGSLPPIALGIFVVAALGGFVLFSFHLRGRNLPKGLIYIHGLAATIAEVLLVISLI